MKKIAIFTGYYLPHLGGVERYTANLCKELKKMNYEISIVTCNYDKEHLETIEATKECKIYRLPVYSIAKTRCPIVKRNKEYKEIMKKLQEEKFDFVIINTRLYIISVLGAKFAKKNKLSCCLIEHGTNHITVQNPIVYSGLAMYEHFLTKIIKRNVDNFYGVSKGCIEWLKHFKIQGKGVFYNSIDTEDYEKFKEKYYPINKDSNDIIITYASRIIKEKGIYNLIEAFQEVKQKYPNIKLIIAGEGPLLSEIKKNNEQDTNIQFTNKLEHDEVMALYNVSDIFVHPSMYPEGLPTSILEAGLMKCAVIATDRGGTIEVVEDEKNGLIVEENVIDLVRKLELILENQELMNQFKERIHEKIMNQFSWKNTAKTIVNSINTNQNT